MRAQLCPSLCDPIDCSLPGSSVHGVFQARILEWVAISSSRGSSQPSDRTPHLLHQQAESLPLCRQVSPLWVFIPCYSVTVLLGVSTKQVIKLKVLLTELLTDAIMVKPQIIKTLNNKQPNLPTVGKLLKLRTVWPCEAILFRFQKNPSVSGNSLVIQWLGLHAFIAEVRELRSCKLLGQKQKNKTKMFQYIIS